jgi:formylglycine-generating enzyme required for sulfatase activity
MATSKKTAAAAQVTKGSGAAASGRRAQAASRRGANVGGDNHGVVNTGDTHHHYSEAAASAAGAASQGLIDGYLRRLRERTAHLALLAGGDMNKPVQLSAVYTGLWTDMRDVPMKRGKRAVRGDADLPPHPQNGEPLSAVAMLDREPRLVLLGGPGSGKSTFVNFVAHCMALEHVGGADGTTSGGLQAMTRPLRPPAGERDATGDGKAEIGPQPWRHGRLLPVLVVLRDLAAQLPEPSEPAGAKAVWDYLQRELDIAGMADALPPLQSHLRDHGGLLLFDGLDEVPEANQRRAQLLNVVADVAQCHAACRIVVTCRTYAYQQQDWKLPGFAEAPLARFGPAQVQGFVQGWYAHMAALQRLTPDDASARCALLLRQVRHNPRVAELAQRPLLLTLFARLQTEKDGDLPERRDELYQAAVDLLLNDWEGAKRRSKNGNETLEPSLTEWLKASRDEVRTELNRLAFEAHRDQAGLQGTADIREADLLLALIRASKGRADVQPVQLQAYLRDRAGILVEHGVGMLQFPHRSFQEYLAACHLANDDFPYVLADLLRADPERWREVVLLSAAFAASGNSALPTWALVEELCRDDLVESSSPADAWAALLAGQVLVASKEHVNARPRFKPMIDRVVRSQLVLMRGPWLPAIDRAAAGRTLDALGDPRPEVMTLDGMQFCWVPPGPFWMGSDTLGDEYGPRHLVDLPQGFFIGRYPVTRAQWRAFVAAGGVPDDADSLAGQGNAPVTFVTWNDAQRFCVWLTQHAAGSLPPGWQVALPTEAEWEKAAGADAAVGEPALHSWQALRAVAVATHARPTALGRDWPWGDEADEQHANCRESGVGQTSAVGCFAQGAAASGAEDIAGNVWEWTCSLWGEDVMTPSFNDPIDPADGARNDNAAAADVWRHVRGGAWFYPLTFARCAHRDRNHPEAHDPDLGFRVVLRSAAGLAR